MPWTPPSKWSNSQVLILRSLNRHGNFFPPHSVLHQLNSTSKLKSNEKLLSWHKCRAVARGGEGGVWGGRGTVLSWGTGWARRDKQSQQAEGCSAHVSVCSLVSLALQLREELQPWLCAVLDEATVSTAHRDSSTVGWGLLATVGQVGGTEVTTVGHSAGPGVRWLHLSSELS